MQLPARSSYFGTIAFVISPPLRFENSAIYYRMISHLLLHHVQSANPAWRESRLACLTLMSTTRQRKRGKSFILIPVAHSQNPQKVFYISPRLRTISHVAPRYLLSPTRKQPHCLLHSSIFELTSKNKCSL